ncbi:hypothetical protein SCALM49S_07346 [Streptomyces californicus]
MASKTFDFPVPFSPAMQVKGPKSMDKSRRFLEPVRLRCASACGLRKFGRADRRASELRQPGDEARHRDARPRLSERSGDATRQASGSSGAGSGPVVRSDPVRGWATRRQGGKAFRDGTLDDRSRRRLIRFAKGEENLERFCDRLLDGNGGSGGHGGSGGSGGGNGSGGSGGGDDGGDGPGGDGSRPPVSFHPVPRSALAPDASVATGPGAGSRALPEPAADAPASVRAR